MPMLSRLRGFSLIEAIIAMTIMGAIGGVVAMVMKAPIAAYFDTKQRVVMTDTADTALRRITQDVRTALPGSVSVLKWDNVATSYPFSIGGAAIRATDYTIAYSDGVVDNGVTITIPVGITKFTVTVTAIDDGVPESAEAFALSINGKVMVDGSIADSGGTATGDCNGIVLDEGGGCTHEIPISIGGCAVFTPLIGKGRCENADCAGTPVNVTDCVAVERDGCGNGKRVETCDSTFKTAQVCTLNVSGGNSTLISCAGGATGAACVSSRQFHVVRNEDGVTTENDQAAIVCDPQKGTIEYWSGVSVGTATHCSALTKTSSAILARNATCTDEMFRYTSAEAPDGSSNSGILEMTLELMNANGDEKVRMQREVFVGFQ